MSVTVNGNTYLASADGKIYGQYPAGGVGNSNALVLDDFESGDLLNPLVNNINFAWGTGVPVGGVTVETDPDDAQNHAMRMRYTPGVIRTEEQFTYDARTSMWVKYRIRVPDNYSNVDGNHKWIALWQDGYSQAGDGSTLFFTAWPNGEDLDMSWSYTLGNNTSSSGSQQLIPFIDTSADQGRWMTFVLQIDLGTGNNDGFMNAWRAWDGESYIKMFNGSNIPFKINGGGFRNGYLLGSAGVTQGYSATTDWFIDDFEISDSDPIGGLT
jgi:hypothetical protein